MTRSGSIPNMLFFGQDKFKTQESKTQTIISELVINHSPIKSRRTTSATVKNPDSSQLVVLSARTFQRAKPSKSPMAKRIEEVVNYNRQMAVTQLFKLRNYYDAHADQFDR